MALIGAVTIPVLTASAAPVKSKIKIMSIATVGATTGNYPEVWARVQGAALDINSHGGINGHKLQVITCNDNFDPNGATACANEAVADHVTAVVGAESTYITNILPILNAHHIASLGSTNASALELTSPNSFTFSGGTGLLGNAFLTELINNGYNKVAVVYIDIPIVAPIVAGLKASVPTLGNGSGSVVATIPVSPTQTDFSTIAAAVKQSGATSVNFVLSSVQADLATEADYQAGIGCATVPAALFSMTKTDLDTLGPAANGCYYVSTVVPLSQTKNKYVKQVLADFKSANFTGPISDYGTQGWAATMAAANIMKKFKVYTSAKFLADVPKFGPMNLHVIGQFNWSKPLTSQLPNRIYNANYIFNIVKNGVIVPQTNGFVNILKIH
jgi:ABC-type branched-subunit amino acid transport system substrate-binding protein